jgi:hypothetical protein
MIWTVADLPPKFKYKPGPVFILEVSPHIHHENNELKKHAF